MLTIAQRAGPTAPTSGPTVYLLDNFPDAVPTSLVTRPMQVGGNWTSFGGTWLGSAGSAHDSSSINPDGITGDALHADATESVLITLGTDCGIVARGVDSSNYLLVRVQANDIQVYSIIAGGANLKSDTVVVWPAGGTHTLTVTTSGTTVVVKLDGALVVSNLITDFAAATRWGLWANSDTASTFANFSVSS